MRGSTDALFDLCVEEILRFFCLRKAVEHFPFFHRTRTNDVDTNSCAGEFDGRRLRVAFHGVLAADIHRPVGPPTLPMYLRVETPEGPLLNFSEETPVSRAHERLGVLSLDKKWTKSAPGLEPTMI